MYKHGSSYNTCTYARFITLYVIHSLYTTNIHVPNTYILSSANTYMYVWFHYYIYVLYMKCCNIICSTYNIKYVYASNSWYHVYRVPQLHIWGLFHRNNSPWLYVASYVLLICISIHLQYTYIYIYIYV